MKTITNITVAILLTLAISSTAHAGGAFFGDYSQELQTAFEAD